MRPWQAVSALLWLLWWSCVGVSQQPPLTAPQPQGQGTTALERAKASAQKGDWQSALREFEKAVKDDPKNTDARMGLTEALLQLGEFRKALPHLQWLSQRLPRNPRVWSTLGQVQEQLGNLDNAVAALRKAVHLQPNEPEFRVHLARVLIAKERWDDAAHHLRWLAHRVPDLASVQYHLALYYEQRGNLDKALHHARRTVQLSPKEPEARLTLARLSLQKGDLRTAASQLETLLKQFPNNPELAMESAKLFAQAGDNKRAIRYFRRTLHLQPDNADAHRALADLYGQQKSWEKALWHLRWLARRFPDDPKIARAEAQAYGHLRCFREAEKALQRWAKARPNDPEPFVHMARLAHDLGETAKARMAYDEALKRRPPTEVIAEVAEWEFLQGEWERAARLYEWAQRREPENPQWRAKRVEALLRAGRFDRAVRILRFALKQFPNHPRLKTLMGLWHAKRVEWVEAEPYLKKGIGMETNPKQPDLQAVGALVEIWLCQGRAREALTLCEGLLKTAPSAEVLIWWAQAMDELGKGKEAAQRLERSQAFQKGDERVAQVAARLWELQNEPERAGAVWQRFAQQVPNKSRKAVALLRAAGVWERAQDIPKALAVLDKAKSLMPQEPVFSTERIRLLHKAQAFAAALSEATQLLSRYPYEHDLAGLYAEVALSQWQDAAFERIAERVLQNGKLVGGLVIVAQRLRREKDAIEALEFVAKRLKGEERSVVLSWLKDLRNALALQARTNSSDPAAQEWEQAQQAADQKEWRTALWHCRKVLTQRPDFLPAYELLLKAYQQQNDIDHAVRGFTALANRQRDDLSLNFAAATALSLDGQYRRAVTYWRRVCALTDNDPEMMLRLAENLAAIREDIHSRWIRKFVQRLERWEGLAHAAD